MPLYMYIEKNSALTESRILNLRVLTLVLSDPLSVGTDKVMEVSSAKPGDVIQSKEDDDEDNDDENDDDDDDDLVDTGM